MVNDIEKITDILTSWYWSEKGLNRNGASFKSNGSVFPWKNADNILFGSLGKAVFALDLYHHTNDLSIRDDVLRYEKWISDHCRRIRTNNYTLYCGRLGVAFFYLSLFKITKDESFLSAAVSLTDGYIHPISNRIKLLDKVAMVGGYPSIILFFLELYDVTGHEYLILEAKKYLEVLISQCTLNDAGLFWSTSPANSRSNIGWAYGGTGIAGVMLKCAEYFERKDLISLVSLILKYQERFFDATPAETVPLSLSEWSKYSFADGTAGFMAVKLYKQLLAGEGFGDMGPIEHLATLQEKLLSNPDGCPVDLSIANGIAGWGLCFKQAYRITGRDRWLTAAQTNVELLCGRRNTNGPGHSNDSTLCTGTTGVSYALLNLIRPRSPESLFFPWLYDYGHSPGSQVTTSDRAVPTSSLSPEKIFLESNFSQTKLLLDRRFGYHPEPSGIDLFHTPVQSFLDFVDRLDKINLSEAEKKEIQYTANKEAFIARIKENCFGRQYQIQKAIRWTDIKIESLLDMELKKSEDLFILFQEPAIDITKPVSREEFNTLLSTYGSKSYFFRVNKFRRLEEYDLAPPIRAIVEQFSTPISINKAVNRIIQFITSQDPDFLIALKSQLSAKNNADMIRILRINLIDLIILEIQWGFFVFADQFNK